MHDVARDLLPQSAGSAAACRIHSQAFLHVGTEWSGTMGFREKGDVAVREGISFPFLSVTVQS